MRPMNHLQTTEFRYAVYTRKSSEYEDSQVQSIQRQIEELAELISREQLVVRQEYLSEAQSAFHPGREQFGNLVKWTQEGKVNAWVCWHANRLSRNPVDAGTIVYLMDQGKLHHIRTKERVYYNTPTDKFMLQLDFSMSKKDSDDKSSLVRSGILRRHRRGYPNGSPPVGFLIRGQGRSGQSIWVTDPNRYDLVRRVFRRYLEGKDSITTIWRFAEEIGLTTVPRKAVGGRIMPRSAFRDHFLTNPVYAGFFYGTDGQRYDLDETLPRPITEEDHVRIHEILGSRHNSKKHGRKFREVAYRGLLRTAEGDPLGVEVKFQLICDCKRKFAYLNRERCPKCDARISNLLNPKYLVYTYYYSNRDRRDPTKTAKVVSEEKIDRFLIENFARPIQISPSLRDWAMRYLESYEDAEIRDRNLQAKRFEDFRTRYVGKRKRLRELLLSGQITEDEYQSDIAELERVSEEEEKRITERADWMTDARNVLNLAVECENIIVHGDALAKNQAFRNSCSNLVWDGENLLLHKGKLVSILFDTLKKAREKNPRFEPEKDVDTSGRNEDFESVRPVLCRGLDSIRT